MQEHASMIRAAINYDASALPPKQESPSVWYGPDMVNRQDEWNLKLQADEVAELRAAAEEWLSSREHIATEDLSVCHPAEFSLPKMARKRLPEAATELMRGRGFLVFSGLPVDEMTERESAAIFSGLASHMGSLRPQDARGSLVGHVRNQGLSSSDPNVRIYQTAERQGFHCDWADVVGLLCLQPAAQGGDSLVVSATAIWNEMRAQRPDLAAALLEPIPTDRRGEVSLGEKPYDMIPVFSWHGGFLTTLTHRVYINSAQRFADAPRLTPTQIMALDMFDELANSPAMHFKMRLAPGDMQFVYNHALLHDRTAYVDAVPPPPVAGIPDDHKNPPDLRRHLLRVWLALPGDRPLPETFASRYGSVEVGNRGGVWVAGGDTASEASATSGVGKAAALALRL